MKALKLLGLACVLTSCGGDDGVGGVGAKISQTFTDSAVTNFQQTSGVAKTNFQKASELIIQSAYAGIGTISCINGETANFQMDALSNTINISTTCSSSIDLSIRRGLLQSMDGIAIKRTISDASYKNGAIDFRASGANGGFQFGLAYKVVAIWKDAVVNGGNNDGVVDSNEVCYEQYIFNSNGTVTIAPHSDNTTQNSNNGSLGCALVGAYNDTANFRFKDGALELDLTANNNFDSTGVFPSGHPDAGSSSYEKWELCTVGTNCKI